MFKTVLICLLLTSKCTLQNDYNGLVQTISNFFHRRHVQTVTAATCWSPEVNRKLLTTFSAMDKSLSFSLYNSQTFGTWYRHGFLIDLSCDRSLNFMHKMSTDRMFDLQNDWLMFDRKLISNESNALTIASDVFQTYLNESYVLPDSGVFLFQEIGHNIWEIWTGFRASKLHKIRVYRIGVASENRIEIEGSNKLRTNFRGVTLQAITVIIDRDNFFGFESEKTIPPTDLDIYSHMNYALVKTLSQQLNFKLNLTITDDYGRSYGNGTYYGLTGILKREESDLSAAGNLITHDRLSAVDFILETMVFESNLLFKQPKWSTTSNFHLRPFTFGVWSMIVFTFIGFVTIITFLNKFKVKRAQTLNALDVIELVYGAICQQGTSFVFIVPSMRVVVFVLFLTASFLCNSYSATIVSLLRSTIDSIKNVDDVIREESMTISLQDNHFVKTYINETTDPNLRSFYVNKIKPYGNRAFVNVSFGVERTRTDFHGYMIDTVTGYTEINKKWSEEDKCALYGIPMLKLQNIGIPVPKKSGHKDVFKQKLILQCEVGIKKRLIERRLPPKPSCDPREKNRQFVSVSFKNILSTLKFFVYGVLLSVVVFLFELTYHSYKANYRNSGQLEMN